MQEFVFTTIKVGKPYHQQCACLPEAVLHYWLQSVEIGEIQDAQYL